ncbi:hypothetical protein LTR05_003776 [Lithohypha guttulata]|uniref:Calcineurin-like phosphoesterase domain-containing protein n=1 Tax=Lithohypha guttulata TaxID=1690604 RepID=A0AAN7Y6R6_9EURO|nr:hypothetical protein LTR05_003776 [Lithohypha guttulata]
MTGKLSEHKRAVALLKSLPAPLKIVIPGNHDLTLDRAYCSEHPRLYEWDHDHTEEELTEAISLYTNDEAIKAGIVYLVEGTRSFTLANGAQMTVYASAYTPEFYDWAFPYPRDLDRFNNSESATLSNPVPSCDSESDPGPSDVYAGKAVNLMITHGPPKGVLDKTATGQDNYDLLSEQQRMFVGYIDATNIRHGAETAFVNASIMNLQYEPVQKPWIVDLKLPKAP